RLSLFNHPANTPDLLQRCREEVLMPETRIDRHHQHLLHILQNFLEHRGWSCRVDPNSGSFTQRVNALYRAVQIRIAFPMNEERIGASVGELFQENIWV